MTTVTKKVTVYIAWDGAEFTSERKCKNWETHLALDALHKNLLESDFHSRYRISSYFHNRQIDFLGNGSGWYFEDLREDNSFLLMGGRMGNGDDRVRYNVSGKGQKIVLLKFDTEDSTNQRYLGSLPMHWLTLPIDELRPEVDIFIKNHNQKFDHGLE